MPLNDSTVMFLEEEFSSRMDNLTQVMGLHPHYLQAFLRCHYYLLRMDGPLPLHYRHYIAIMVQTHRNTFKGLYLIWIVLRVIYCFFQAAARHQCSTLVCQHVQEFEQIGVCSDWLRGLEFCPQRLRNLNEINKILAHRPWLITKQHIQVTH